MVVRVRPTHTGTLVPIRTPVPRRRVVPPPLPPRRRSRKRRGVHGMALAGGAAFVLGVYSGFVATWCHALGGCSL